MKFGLIMELFIAVEIVILGISYNNSSKKIKAQEDKISKIVNEIKNKYGGADK
jgi:Na+-translocating ferredoxin:NAD+ oxidoreductase RnfG subunit